MVDFGDSIFIDPAALLYYVEVNVFAYFPLAALRVVFFYLVADSILIAEFFLTTVTTQWLTATSQHSG